MNVDIPEIKTYFMSTDDNGNKNEFRLPDPYEVGYWRARTQRTFYIDYEIDSQTGTDKEILFLSKTIIEMNVEEKDTPKEELKPITIYIHSLGGEIDVSLNLADIMIASRIPIITVGMGNVMSAGFLIFAAGTRRYVFEHTNMMIHSGSASLSGTAEQLAAAQSNYKQLLDQMKAYILNRTEIPEKVFKKNQAKDWYLNLDEIQEYNVANVATITIIVDNMLITPIKLGV